MELAQMITALSGPSAYPFSPEKIEVRQTHISVVFLAGDVVYKIKKPVNLGFLDFSTLEKRLHFCREEVRLNRRLAPQVYRAVVPVTRSGAELHFEGDGEIVEWAVKMQRLPDDATLEQRLAKEEVDEATLRKLAHRLAQFHAQGQTNQHIADYGRFEVVAGNAHENFTQSRPLIGETVSPAVFDAVRRLTEEHLQRLAPLIEKRAAAKTRDTHGDLRLDHVYLFPEKQPPDDVVIIDCIEFNERFRFADPVADAAFLIMDLLYKGHYALARFFTDAYLQAANDDEGRQLMPFYTAYRAVVRGKVEGMKALENEVPAAEKEEACRQARAHWLLALVELAEPIQRPCLLLVGGLPGTGKSTIAAELAARANFNLLRSDVIRKELAGLPAVGNANSKEDIYTPQWNEKTYQECLAQIKKLLWEGQRVIMDATFRQEKYRRLFLEEALHLGVPGLFLCCRAEDAVVKERLRQRRNDASDADWEVYQKLAQSWQPPEGFTRQRTVTLCTEGDKQAIVKEALDILRQHELI